MVVVDFQGKPTVIAVKVKQQPWVTLQGAASLNLKLPKLVFITSVISSRSGY